MPRSNSSATEAPPKQAVPLLAFPFRPFFLLTGAYATVVVLAWIGFLFGNWPLPLGWSPLQWHSHEMIYGFVAAAIAGFLLTAICNWTGARPLQGTGLVALVGLWFAGRLVFWFAGWLPGWLVAAVDLAFLPVLAVYVAQVLLRHGNKRNLMLVGVLALLTLGNVLMHTGLLSGNSLTLRMGQTFALDVITLMMVIIAGRILPLFTVNWLRNNGVNPELVVRSEAVNRASILGVVAVLVLALLPAPGWLLGGAAIFAGLANGVRLFLWCGWLTVREPLLWILHLAYLWIVMALLLRGVGEFSTAITPSLWQHTLGVGAIGTLILGIMTRVIMGHTGRPLQLLPYALISYWALIAATFARLLAAAGLLDYRLGVTLSALGWALAFGLFVVLYLPILIRPRADGRPG